MQLRAIDHVTLYVRDLDAVRPYYEEVFGFSCSELRTEAGRGLQLETDSVHLFIVEAPERDPGSVRMQHVSFEVAELGAVARQLDSRGEAYETGQYSGFRSRNYRWIEWRDPEGIRVECVEHIEHRVRQGPERRTERT